MAAPRTMAPWRKTIGARKPSTGRCTCLTGAPSNVEFPIPSNSYRVRRPVRSQLEFDESPPITSCLVSTHPNPT
jgi:hypothetical protein